LLAALLTVGFLPYSLSAIHAARSHQVFLGVSGVFPFDQDQYLAYAASAPAGVIRNLYGSIGARVFVDPVWSISGIVEGLTRISPAFVMAFWNLIGALTLFAGARHLTNRYISAADPWRRTVAMLLSLFGGMTIAVSVGSASPAQAYAASGVDLMPVQSVWGYAPIAIAIGLMPFALTGMERLAEGDRSSRTAGLTFALCLLVGWLHPWQGATLMLIGLGLMTWRWAERRSICCPGWQILLIASGLLAGPAYFKLLPMINASWGRFDRADQTGFTLSSRYILEALVPSLAFAGMGAWRVWGRARELRVLLIWPVAVLALVAMRPPEVFHSFDGLALPLGVLCAFALPRYATTRRGAAWRGICLLALAVQLISIALVTSTLINFTQGPWRAPLQEVRSGDVAAIRVAHAHARGRPILTTQELGVVLPLISGDATWVGDEFWTPDVQRRVFEADRFFLGHERVAQARRFVDATGARTVVEPCGWTHNLTPTLRPLGFRRVTVGCSTVYFQS
jgi:hypothetical protein